MAVSQAFLVWDNFDSFEEYSQNILQDEPLLKFAQGVSHKTWVVGF